MADILRIVCPVDGLEIPLTDMMRDFTDHLATVPVGYQVKFEMDPTRTCANGHHWAVDFRVELTREA